MALGGELDHQALARRERLQHVGVGGGLGRERGDRPFGESGRSGGARSGRLDAVQPRQVEIESDNLQTVFLDELRGGGAKCQRPVAFIEGRASD